MRKPVSTNLVICDIGNHMLLMNRVPVANTENILMAGQKFDVHSATTKKDHSQNLSKSIEKSTVLKNRLYSYRINYRYSL